MVLNDWLCLTPIISNTLNDNIYLYYSILKISFRYITIIIEIGFRIFHFGYILNQSRDHVLKKQRCPRLWLKIYPKLNIVNYVLIMDVIDLNVNYKIIYYKYILSIKVLDIIGVKHSQ